MFDSPESVQTYLELIFAARDFMRRHSPADYKPLVDRWFSFAAANGFLFTAQRGNRIAAASFAGPVTDEVLTELGASLTPADFDRDGTILYCAWNVVLPRYRGRGGQELMADMLEAATTAFPDCHTLAYARGHRNDTRIRQRPIRLSAEVEA